MLITKPGRGIFFFSSGLFKGGDSRVTWYLAASAAFDLFHFKPQTRAERLGSLWSCEEASVGQPPSSPGGYLAWFT